MKDTINRAAGLEGVGWIDLAQNWDKWRAVVDTVMNFREP